MSGNIEEWVKDTYESDYYKNSLQYNPCNENESDEKTVRGGGVRDYVSGIYMEKRWSRYVEQTSYYRGFRFCYNDNLKK